MSRAFEAAKRAVLARHADLHMGECEHCKPYVEELAKAEMENRKDPMLNRAQGPMIRSSGVKPHACN